jgi:3-hexulose-6-phosphate synthase
MKLQVAMDVATLDEALALSRPVAEYVDIIELGAPLIENEGVAAIGAVKASSPHTTICADLGTAGAGELGADIAFGAGADLVRVTGGADDDTVRGAVAAARSHGGGVVADMSAVRDGVTRRAREVVMMGVAFCEFHAAPDEQGRCGYSVRAAIEAGRQAEVPFSVAGDLDLDDVRDVHDAGALVAVVGAAVLAAPDPRAAALGLRVAVDTAPVALLGDATRTRQGRPHGIPCGPGPKPGRARQGQLAGHVTDGWRSGP